MIYFICLHTYIECNLGAELGQYERGQYNLDSDDGTKPNMIEIEPNEANKKPIPRNRRKPCSFSNDEGTLLYIINNHFYLKSRLHYALGHTHKKIV